MPIDLYPQETPENQIDLFHQDTAPLSPEVIARRTQKADYGLGELSPGLDSIGIAISSGNENSIRNYAAQKVSQKVDATKQSVLQDKIQSGVTQKDLSTLQALAAPTTTDPQTVLEQQFSHRIVNESQSQPQDIPSPPSEADHENMDIAEYQGTRNQIAGKILEDAKSKEASRGQTDKVFDAVGQVLPGLWWWQGQNAVDTNETQLTGILPGDNWESNSTYLHLLPPSEFHLKLQQAVDKLYQYSPDRAVAFASYVLAHGTADTTLNNLLGIGDVADVASTVAGPLLKAGKLVSDVSGVSKSLKDVLQASGEVKTSVPNILSSVGQTTEAAKIQAPINLAQKLVPQDTSFRGTGLWEAVPSITNPQAMGKRAINFSREETQRIVDGAVVGSEKLQAAILDPALAKRLSLRAEDLAVDETIERVRKEWTGPKDAILNISPSTEVRAVKATLGKAVSKSIGDVNSIEMHLGRPDATLFTSKQQANAYAGKYHLPTGGYRVESLGKKFYLAVEHDVNEGNLNVLAAHAIDTEAQPHMNLSSGVSGITRGMVTPENFISDLSRQNRHLALHAHQAFYDYVSSEARNIGSLAGKERKNLADFLDNNRDWHTDIKNPKTGVTETQFGRNISTIADFETAYKSFSGVYPTEGVAKGFFSAKRLSDLDYILRNLGMFRDLASKGYAYREFRLGDETVKGVIAKDREFIPKQSDHNADADILFIKDDGTTEIFRRNSRSEDQITQLNAKIRDEGYKIVEVANPVQRPFKQYGINEPINFVIGKEFGHKPLDFQLLPYSKAVGHSAYEQEWFGKQAVITKYADKIEGSNQYRLGHNYEGDKAVFVQSTEAEARKYVPLMNKARLLFRDGKPGELSAFLRKDFPIYDSQDVARMFTKGKDKDGLETPAPFDVNEPIIVAHRTRSVLESDPSLSTRYQNLNNLADSPYNAWKAIPLEYTGQRNLDLNSIRETSAGLRLDPAKKISAYETMTKAMASATRDRFFKNYQTQAVGSWIRQFSGALQGNLQDLLRNPIQTFNNPPWSKTSNVLFKNHAVANRLSVLTFMGEQNEIDKVVEGIQQKLASSLYNNLGQKAGDFASGFKVTRIEDPVKHARAIAFHAKLGFLNPIPMFTNAVQMITASAITGSPTRVFKGLSGALLMRAVRTAPQHLDFYAGKAANLGWDAEDFKNSYLAMKRSGFDNIEGDIGYLDDVINPTLFKGTASSWLNKGTILFKGSDRMTRLHSWGLAWHEFREQFPKVQVTDREVAKILTRADDLSGNMTRASNSSLQRGVWSIPLQFFAWQQRSMEQMLGKRLTGAEKLRVLSVNSLLYGVPTAVTGIGGPAGAIIGGAYGAAQYMTVTSGTGASLASIPEDALKGALGPFWPFYDDIREEGLAHGVPMDNVGIKAMMEGIPAMLIEWATGSETNFGPRFGPSGTSIVKDAIFSDKPLQKIISGVSGSVLGDSVSALHPFIHSMMSAFSDKNDQYPLVMNDFTNLAASGPISTLSNAAKAYMILETGKFMSKNGVQQEEGLSPWDALFSAFLGLSPRSVNDAFLMKDHEQGQKDAQAALLPEISKTIREMGKVKSEAEMNEYFSKVHALFVLGGFQPDDVSRIFSQSLQGLDSTTVDSIEQRFYLQPQNTNESGRANIYLNKKGN